MTGNHRTSRIDVRMLGPMRIARHDRQVDVSRMICGTLAILALANERVVSTSELVHGLWRDPSEKAESTLRAYMSRARKVIGGDQPVAVRGLGYVWQRDGVFVDVLEFERLVRKATSVDDSGAAAAALESALQLWHGTSALENLADLPFAAEVRARLQEARRAALKQHGKLLIARRSWDAAIAPLQTLLSEAPLREDVAEMLIRALNGAGRRAEALDLCDRLVARLPAKGLEVGTPLLALRRQIITHAPVGSVGSVDLHHATSTSGQSNADVGEVSDVPLPLTSFIGREQEITGIVRQLHDTRLLTLWGPPGCGKTRLALEVLARREIRDVVEQRCLMHLTNVADARLLPDALAEQLGVGSVGAGVAKRLIASLDGREILLVFDNCEHIIAGVAELAATLLQRCRGLQILATSREPLRIEGEQLYRIPPMPVGTSNSPGDAERLFVDRARLVRPDITMDESALTRVHRICHGLDGIPLAIELAAARLTTLSLGDIAQRLDDRFLILGEGARTGPAHHKTLADAVEWSYDLLTARERHLMCIAATFRGAFALEALDNLAAPDGEDAVVTVLASLVNRSIVTAEMQDSQPRYRLLETLRNFAQLRTEPDIRAALCDRHASFFINRADVAYEHLRTLDGAKWWRWLELEMPNLNAALEHSIDTGHALRAYQLVGALAWFWYRRGYGQQGQKWCERVRALGQCEEPAILARFEVGATGIAFLNGDVDEAFRCAAGAAQAADEAGDATLGALARGYVCYGAAAHFDDPQGAATALRDALTVANKGAARWVKAELAVCQAAFQRQCRKLPEALATLTAGREIADECGHDWGGTATLWLAAKIRVDRGDGRGAANDLVQMLRRCARERDRTSPLAALHIAAAAAACQGRYADGARLLGAVDKVGDRIGYTPMAMDPIDSANHRDMVKTNLTSQQYEQAYNEGRGFSVRDAVALTEDLSKP